MEMKEKNFIIMFDIPRNSLALQRRVNRKLHTVKAVRVQHSVCKSKHFNDLDRIAAMISDEDGKATILKEDIIAHY
jgi:hypothetical protein